VWRVAKADDFYHHIGGLKYFFDNSVDFGGKTIQCKVIWSGKGAYRYIDFVHKAGGKHAGVRYAQQRFQISPTKTAVAGDSGNDIDMFTGEELGVVVGNYEPELADFVRGGNVVNKFISQAFYADAVLEAVARL
jgi:hydroxymethylpyrimidine pyrophosphatase-like HAD family hydrolase